ncbi:hypothetical protein PCANC_19807 [Puccinia coronata f. sp. avenae]|uniref:Uncharacterized protein n=1 Tax=Puccinia coronata f. sp. avenae TaxID=200324 RepID=A0A2N5UPU7_9BASI|nr:hypothetical protein PCANC_19807 [Puccinia coronata f. sp. avenae]
MAPPECNMRQHANVTQQSVPDPIVAPNTVPLTDGANTAKAAPAKSTATPAAGIRLVQDIVADNGIIIITEGPSQNSAQREILAEEQVNRAKEAGGLETRLLLDMHKMCKAHSLAAITACKTASRLRWCGQY